MQCWTPISLTNPRRLVPCGRCLPCLERRRSHWTARLLEESKNHTSSHFVTLTYQDKFLPTNSQNIPILQMSHLQNYIKRVRKECSGIKYYAVGEYGEKFKRPHYHLIIFSADQETLVNKWKKENEDGEKEMIGRTDVGTVTNASIHYVTGYVMGYKKKTLPTRPFAIMSKGLGKSYVTAEMAEYHINNMNDKYTKLGGQMVSMPRYWKEQIFDDEMKEVLSEENRLIAEDLLKSKTYYRHMSERTAKRHNYSNNKKFKL